MKVNVAGFYLLVFTWPSSVFSLSTAFINISLTSAIVMGFGTCKLGLNKVRLKQKNKIVLLKKYNTQCGHDCRPYGKVFRRICDMVLNSKALFL